MGALWGFGHSIGQLILGLLMVLLKVRESSVPAVLCLGSWTTLPLKLHGHYIYCNMMASVLMA